MRSVDRRATLRSALLAAATTFTPAPSVLAWCGEGVPSWAFYLKWDENPSVPFEVNGKTSRFFCRIVGDLAREEKAGVPPVLIVGNPGFGYDYLENLEALAVTDRRLFEVTFAGSVADGTPSELLSHEACAEQLKGVARLIKKPMHIIAHGLGAPAAVRFVEQSPNLARSLTLVSPYGSIADLRADVAETDAQKAAMPKATASILLPTVSGNARGSCVADAIASSGGPLAGVLLRSGERLGGDRLAARLRGLNLPVLLVNGGSANEIVDSTWEGLPSAVTRQVYERSGHLPFVDERDAFLFGYGDFLDRVDGVTTNRELKFADPLKMVQEVMQSDGTAMAAPKDCSAYKTEAARAYCEKSSRRN